jgi:hypothetical protein
MKVVNTDNFGSDYPAERFLNVGSISGSQAKRIADILNEGDPNASRYWKVVPDNYELAPGFEP